MKKAILIIFLALLIRLTLAPLYHHGDADSIFYQGKYLWETRNFFLFLGKAVPNTMPAIYPPLFYYLLFFWRGLYAVLGEVLWWINVHVPLFPSGLIPWYQSYTIGIAFNKILAILSDLGCAWIIWKLITILRGDRGDKDRGKLSVLLFLFLPATWYLSAYWGQFESLYSIFILWGFYLILKEKWFWGIFSVVLSALIKPTSLIVLPVVLIYVLKQKKLTSVIWSTLFSLLITFFLYLPFFGRQTLVLAPISYFSNLRGEITYLVCNAFNFWSLLFGFNPHSDSTLFLGVSFFIWGIVIFGLIAGFVIWRLWCDSSPKTFITAAFLVAYGSFLFMPRMHERYFFTAYIFLPILASTGKKWFYFFIILSVFYFFNLYHFWWYPKIPFLISFLSSPTILSAIILIEIGLFLISFRDYLKT